MVRIIADRWMRRRGQIGWHAAASRACKHGVCSAYLYIRQAVVDIAFGEGILLMALLFDVLQELGGLRRQHGR